MNNSGETMKFHEYAGIFPLLDGTEFDDLVSDIRAHGQREPIILFEGEILDGRNRYRACYAAGVDPTFETYHGDDPLAYVVSLNLKRRHLDESQRAWVAAKIANLPHGGDRTKTPIGGLRQADAARMLNVGERSVERAAAVRDHGATELQQAVERGQVKVSTAADIATRPVEEQREIVARGERQILEAAKTIRAEKAEERRKERIANLVEISMGNADLSTERKYPVIYADPPWEYENLPMGGSNRSIENHYPTMTLEEICALDVANLATPDAMLYLWATAPKLAECMKVVDSWGFEYRTCMVWVKDKIGMGYHARNQHEILLICKRGELPPPPVDARPSSVIHAPRTEHSAKPIEFYEVIERMYPELPKIELFCRSPRQGWAVWGNQSKAA